MVVRVLRPWCLGPGYLSILDGTTETLAGPTPGTDTDSPYLLTGGHQR